MSLNGIWKMEMLGVYDWEPVATAFLRDGQYWSGSVDHYGVGHYSVDGGQVVADVTMVIHGKARTLFGRNVARHKVHFEGEFSPDTVKGTADDGEGRHLVRFKATKIAELP